jgi:hypothetical protein
MLMIAAGIQKTPAKMVKSGPAVLKIDIKKLAMEKRVGFLAIRGAGGCAGSGTALADAVNSGDDAGFLRTFGQTPAIWVKG